MSHPTDLQRRPAQDETIKYAKTLHNVALFTIVVCPVLALLPPRKLDIYTVILGSTTLYSGNYLVHERTGRPIWQHITGAKNRAIADSDLQPSKAQPTDLSQGLRHAREGLQKFEKHASSVTEQLNASQRAAWKAQREQEIKDDIEEGKGIADMITDQVWQVWNWGKKTEDDD
ncbi:Hypothetical protein R9X50_00200900 [Acrodontium crateriforme]|uniref:Uncharacterized protein n=1 Tax=Acrodontium crateriforme TaxID=150365 RepID=A0AAQ3M0F6_9PEZI|nr:Hypothetical protein R9X50_00200900 [Acrodontium crateriforme]